MARQAYAHDAVVAMPAGGDERAPGGAVTIALCGSWDHPPPCPLAAHHTEVDRAGDELRVRVLFACAVEDEAEVRSRIGDGLRTGSVTGPDGRTTTWELLSETPGHVRDDERDHAQRLAGG